MRFEADYRIITLNQEIKQIIDRRFSIVNQEGKYIGVTSIADNIPKKKQLLEEIRNKDTELKNGLKKYRNFVLNQEHNIHTSVANVIGLSNAFIEALEIPELVEAATLINKNATAQHADQNSLMDSI